MKIYLSGPMTGYPDWNYPAFHKAAASLRAQGHEVFNPAETDGGSSHRSRQFYMRKDFEALLDSKLNAIALLRGWTHARGAMAEAIVAAELGLKFYMAEEKSDGTISLRQMESVNLFVRRTYMPER